MQHKWTKNKDFKPEDQFYEQHTCSRCGAIRTKSRSFRNGKTFFESYFERSGINFGAKSSTNHSLECLDWDDNTIDPPDENDIYLDF